MAAPATFAGMETTATLELTLYHKTDCLPCMAMRRVLRNHAHELPPSVEVRYVNLYEHPEAIEQYGLRGTPTLVLRRDGQEVDRRPGLMMAGALRHWVEGALDR